MGKEVDSIEAFSGSSTSWVESATPQGKFGWNFSDLNKSETGPPMDVREVPGPDSVKNSPVRAHNSADIQLCFSV